MKNSKNNNECQYRIKRIEYYESFLIKFVT